MTESSLIGEFVKLMRLELRGFVVLRHEDRISSGHPDISVTGKGLTSWIECKYGNPNFASKGIQELTMNRLALTGLAYYVVWINHDKSKERFTYIVNPQMIGEDPKDWPLFTTGFNHLWAIDHIRSRHR